ncbi:MAG: ketopantoate reductase family protein [Gulosibacter sp.]|uniref:ketopantoate reductase family protein n=1 Tax=Gulosibacter sp. TaxID=2817531 RepID=UPI003F8DA58D
MSDQKIAVLGTGANGASIGADFIRAGIDVTFIDQWPAHVEAMKANGLTVRLPDGSEEHSVVNALHLCEVAELRDPFDFVFVSTKTYDTRWVTQLIEPLLHENSIVAGLQNGMTIDTVAEVVGEHRSVGVVLGIAANMFTPGVIDRQIPREGTWFTVGSFNGTVTPQVEAVAQILSHAGTAEISTDIRSSKWMKLIANIPEMLPSAILDMPLLSAVQVPGIRKVMDEASREAYSLALKAGITMLPIFGKTSAEVPNNYQYALDLLDAVLESFSLPDTRVAVLQDWMKGRRAELDAFNGYIVTLGQQFGVPTPVNEHILRIGQDIENGKLTPGIQNAELMREALLHYSH